MSITNARQYRITKAQLARFERAIEASERDRSEKSSENERIAQRALLDQARQQADDLRRQLEEHERIV